jgi:hypothetical protein
MEPLLTYHGFLACIFPAHLILEATTREIFVEPLIATDYLFFGFIH